jgi:hypothetical protein
MIDSDLCLSIYSFCFSRSLGGGVSGIGLLVLGTGKSSGRLIWMVAANVSKQSYTQLFFF